MMNNTKILEKLLLKGFTEEEAVNVIEEIIASKPIKYGLCWEEDDKEIDKLTHEYTTLYQDDLSIVKDREKYLTHRLFEGDNIETLAYLKSNNEKFEFIYIDPPCNTGHKRFIYHDSYHNNHQDYKYRHSEWLQFMFNRLTLAKDLLTDNGGIFISIDDYEFSHLKLLCDEVFGEKNFIGNITWKKTTVKNNNKHISNVSDYILIYAKKKSELFSFNKTPFTLMNERKYNKRDDYYDTRGSYKEEVLSSASIKYSPSLDYAVEHEGVIYTPGNVSVEELEERRKKARRTNGVPSWKWSRKKLEWGIENDMIVFNPERKKIYSKTYEKVNNNLEPIQRGTPIGSFLKEKNFTNNSGSMMIQDMFNEKIFDYPKPVELMKYLLKMISVDNARVLDFFAGSGTIGQAVIELNHEENQQMIFTLATNNENKIAEEITIKRLEKVINGYTGFKSNKVFPPIPANVDYYKTIININT